MSTWTFTVTIPIGLLLRLVGAYVAVGALLVIPADRVLWVLYERRGIYRNSYRAWVASRGPRWYRKGILKWPALVVAATRASHGVARLGWPR